jgi:hypothetical protein
MQAFNARKQRRRCAPHWRHQHPVSACRSIRRPRSPTAPSTDHNSPPRPSPAPEWFGVPSSPGTAAGNAGDDVITFLDTPPNGWTFDGGRGNDIISGPALTVDAGPGNDLIDVVGDTPSTVTCGAGFDVAWADSSDVLSADCERRIETSTPPVLPGVADAVARARSLLNHVPHPDPASSSPTNGVRDRRSAPILIADASERQPPFAAGSGQSPRGGGTLEAAAHAHC